MGGTSWNYFAGVKTLARMGCELKQQGKTCIYCFLSRWHNGDAAKGFCGVNYATYT